MKEPSFFFFAVQTLHWKSVSVRAKITEQILPYTDGLFYTINMHETQLFFYHH